MSSVNHEKTEEAAPDVQALFGAEYYQTGLGHPYERNNHWLDFFGKVAEEIVRSLRPASVFDAGCALGFLVESLWDRGVEAYGVDVSAFAISQVRRDMKPHCRQASLTDTINGRFDLVTCIEVLEHLAPDQTSLAIANITGVTDTILFSSTPSDFKESTHFNVRPIIDWLKLFNKVGFWPDVTYDAGFLAPHAFLLRRRSPLPEDTLLLLTETIRWKSAYVLRQSQNTELNQQKTVLNQRIAEFDDLTATLKQECEQNQKLLNQSRLELAVVSTERTTLMAKVELQSTQLLRHLEATKQCGQLQAELSQVRNDDKALRGQLAETQVSLAGLNAACSRYQQQLSNLHAELLDSVPVFNSFLQDLAHSQAEAHLASFKALVSKLLHQGKLLLSGQRAALRLSHLNHLNDVNAIAGSNFFDPRWYLKQRPDVAESGMNPLIHYLQHGATENCNPSPDFDGVWYLKFHPDVAAAGMNPLLHYVLFGKAEGREIRAVSGDAAPLAPEPPAGSASVQEDNNVPAEEMLRRIHIISASPLFDSAWYLKRYPDVASSGLDPALHYLRFGAFENRNPGPDFDAWRYLKTYPDVAEARLNPLLHYLEYGVNENRYAQAVEEEAGADLLIHNQFIASMPIPTFSVPRPGMRITVVTDGIDAGRLYGGVGTALILVALLAKKLKADIRLVTRRDPPIASSFAHILSTNGIEWNKDVEFLYSPVGGSRAIGVSDSDIFITTSWWTTKAVRPMVDPSRIFYLLQEDERMFYPFGDERLRCEETLADPAIRFLINSELLFEHLTTGPDGYPNIANRGTWFEPAFPRSNYYPEQSITAEGKRQFFFYARPNNNRNLYWRGLETIEAALESGILRPQDWEFNFVGRDVGLCRLPGKAVIHVRENLRWAEYAALIRQISLGLSLMDTPHPSYPPLDLAASGAVVVTNTRGVKTNLARYSGNIICADPSVDHLLNGLASATKLVNDHETQQSNFLRNRLLRDWNLAFEPVLQQVSELFASEIR
jgi:SAM-dependent methyltransferase